MTAYDSDSSLGTPADDAAGERWLREREFVREVRRDLLNDLDPDLDQVLSAALEKAAALVPDEKLEMAAGLLFARAVAVATVRLVKGR